ncbi:Endonuclease/exonuclease/phosphatase [Cubamyces lactineus]|nr:Endonuclease/exonuclease/phosphatase [Cubamyces lactineus]
MTTSTTGNLRLGEGGGGSPPPAEAAPDDAIPEYGGRRGPASTGPLAGRENRGGSNKRKRRPTKAHLRFASLNMRGYRTTGDATPEVLREKRIAVLALQETHLSEERVQMLNRLFDPINETGARGVAFAINKRFVKKPEYVTTEVVRGRALVLDLKWIMNVYGPNDSCQSAEFWKTLETSEQATNLDLLLGDFNIVESPRDRIPERGDSAEATEALSALVRSGQMSDGWRDANVEQKAYTYMQKSTGSQSRIDRIYIRKSICEDADNWDILEPGLLTDHRLAVVDMADRQAPYVGKGRWVMPKHLLTDEKMKRKMREIGGKLVKAIEEMGERQPDRNPQTVYVAFKDELTQAARARAKEKVPKMQKRIEMLREDIKRTLNPPPADNEGGEESEQAKHERMMHAGILQDRLDNLERKRFETARKCVAARHRIQDETMTKKWARSAGTTTMTVLTKPNLHEQLTEDGEGR